MQVGAEEEAEEEDEEVVSSLQKHLIPMETQSVIFSLKEAARTVINAIFHIINQLISQLVGNHIKMHHLVVEEVRKPQI